MAIDTALAHEGVSGPALAEFAATMAGLAGVGFVGEDEGYARLGAFVLDHAREFVVGHV